MTKTHKSKNAIIHTDVAVPEDLQAELRDDPAGGLRYLEAYEASDEFVQLKGAERKQALIEITAIRDFATQVQQEQEQHVWRIKETPWLSPEMEAKRAKEFHQDGFTKFLDRSVFAPLEETLPIAKTGLLPGTPMTSKEHFETAGRALLNTGKCLGVAAVSAGAFLGLGWLMAESAPATVPAMLVPVGGGAMMSGEAALAIGTLAIGALSIGAAGYCAPASLAGSVGHAVKGTYTAAKNYFSDGPQMAPS